MLFSRYRVVGRSIFNNTSKLPNSVMQYHYSQEAVPFCGRQTELDELHTFVKADEKFAWWTITGQAGAGKSRLGFELLRRIPICWFGFFLNDNTTISDINRFKPFTNTLHGCFIMPWLNYCPFGLARKVTCQLLGTKYRGKNSCKNLSCVI